MYGYSSTLADLSRQITGDLIANLFVPQGRLHSLEEELQQDRRVSLQLELLKKEKAQLMSQLTAQESVIDGLRAERRIWGQELAHQGGRHQEKVLSPSLSCSFSIS